MTASARRREAKRAHRKRRSRKQGQQKLYNVRFVNGKLLGWPAPRVEPKPSESRWWRRWWRRFRPQIPIWVLLLWPALLALRPIRIKSRVPLRERLSRRWLRRRAARALWRTRIVPASLCVALAGYAPVMGGATIVAAAGGGNWNANGTWVGGVQPSATSDVQLASTSGNVTLNATAACRSLDCTGYTGNLTHSSGIVCSIGDATAGLGNIALKLVSGMTYTRGSTSSAFTFVSSSATQQTIAHGGKTLGAITWNGVGASYLLSDNLTCNQITHNRAAVDASNRTISSSGNFNNNGATARTFTITNGSVTNSTSGGSAIRFDGSNLTLNASGSTFTCTGSGAIMAFESGHTVENLVMNGGGTMQLNGSFTANGNVTVTGPTSVTTDALTLSANPTIKGAVTFTSFAANRRLQVRSATAGTRRTIALSTTGTVALTDIDFLDIGFSGTNSPATGTRLGNLGNNTGITFSAKTVYWVGNGGNYTDAATHWATASGGAAGANNLPLAQDTAVWDSNSFSSASQTVTMDNTTLGSLDWSAVTNSPAWSIGFGVNVYGTSVVLGAMSVTSATAGNRFVIVQSRSGATLNQGTATMAGTGGAVCGWSLGTLAGTVTAASNLASEVFSAAGGTFNAAGFGMTFGFVTATGTATLQLGSGTWTLTSNNVTVWSVLGTNTVTASTSTIVVAPSGGATVTFTGGGKTYNVLSFAPTVTSELIVTNANTFSRITTSGTQTRTLTFEAGQTQTLTGSAPFPSGSSGNLLTVRSSTAGTAFTLSKTSGVVICDYLSLKDSAATGTARFYAGSHSTNVSGNTGWPFTTPQTVTLTPAIETDSAQAPAATKRTTLVSALESNATQSLVTTKTIYVSITARTETSSIQSPTVIKRAALTPAAETNLARAPSTTKTAALLSPIAATNEVRGLAATKSVELNSAVEVDEAPPLSVQHPHQLALVPIEEANGLHALGIQKSIAVAAVSESDIVAPLSVTQTHQRALTPVAETNSIGSASVLKMVALIPSSELTTIVAKPAVRHVLINSTAESNVVLGPSITKPIHMALGPIDEDDLIIELDYGIPTHNVILSVSEINSVLPISYGKRQRSAQAYRPRYPSWRS